MDVLYYHSPNGNFGDDLNQILWSELLPAECFAAHDAVLLGIGSIFREDFLSAEATRNKRVFVLGSGAGTGPLPARWPNGDWSILAVRGPLTAQLVGRPEAAATDGAALLATARRLVPEAADHRQVVFFPHYNSVAHSRWSEACELAGFEFVDAHWPVAEILLRIARARLVITEAMHGAIVADALRVPWIPVVCSPEILPFKWRDWTRSLELDYRPHVLPPSSGWEALRHLKLRLTDPTHARYPVTSEQDQDYIDDFHRRFGNIAVDELRREPMLSPTSVSTLQRAAALVDNVMVSRAAETLQSIAAKAPSLSDDRVLNDRVERLQNAVWQLRRALM
jgi:succinoglycan biosynthesis protein ExoV